MKKLFGKIFMLAITVMAASCSSEPVKVACVGDSITYGHGIADREHDAYPGALAALLGEKYEVVNFGISGRTLTDTGDSPYMAEQIYRDALAFNPDVVTIKLGTNDSKPFNWGLGEARFKSDLKHLVNSFRELPSKPRIILCLPAPAYRTNWEISDSVIVAGVIPYIEQVASEEGLEIVDLRTPLLNHNEWFPDGIHPNEEGSMCIAKVLYGTITGKEYK